MKYKKLNCKKKKKNKTKYVKEININTKQFMVNKQNQCISVSYNNLKKYQIK